MNKKIVMVCLLAVVTMLSPFSASGQKKGTSVQKKEASVLEKWGFTALFKPTGQVGLTEKGVITIPSGDVIVDFQFKNPPIIKPSKVPNHFEFDSALPKGGSGVKVVFTNSKVVTGDAQIPMFTPIPGKAANEFNGAKFADYGDNYSFSIKLAFTNVGISVVDTNCFRDGAEHHLYGDVILFGAKFSNKSKAPFIFKISGNEYIWSSGTGTVTTKDGVATKIGIP